MVRGGSRVGGTQEDRIDDKDAKHLLDSIGEKVYNEKVKNGDAKKYIKELEGKLSQVSVKSETGGTNETCKLVEDYYKKRVNEDGLGNGDPCKGLSEINVERFSDKIGGQCTNEKMRSGGKGACAPYRRLHLCHHNLETINNTTSTTSDNAKHKLLLEVCMAAKYEGKSIRDYYPIYKEKYGDYGSTICTVLARSFADIGDIVRGKDLYLGNTQEKEQREKLDEKLKEIFENIHDKLGDKAKKHYKDEDDDKKNFYRLREDWWALNRQEIWKALTCDEDNKLAGASYFRPTCSMNGSGAQANDKCTCNNGDVPTYFDYVPQYLRWFEEWAEDFCRLRKRKLKDAKEQCREKHKGDKKLYCDLNRHDCVETIRGDERFVEDEDCKYCHFSCSHFVKWIDNQKLEFLKQKKKYDKEIKKADGTNRTSIKIGNTTINNIYAKEFYKKLKRAQYKDVEKFLKKLSEEQICKDQPYNDESIIAINFKNYKHPDIFSRTKYCEACPWCGAQKKSNGGNGWEPKQQNCGKKNRKIYDKDYITEIPILYPDKEKSGVLQKYNKFCKNNGGNGAPVATPGTANGGENGKKGDQIVTWECYYDKNKPSGQNNNCVEGTWQNFRGKETVKSYNVFFWDWVHDMLHDSLDWRNELGSCINNELKPCKNLCNKKCDCFLKWVVKKKDEWKKIKDHFGKQDDIGQPQSFLGSLFSSPSYVLKEVLKDGNLLQNIKDTHADADDIERIGKMLKEEENQVTADGVGTGVGGGVAAGGNGANGEHNTKIDNFLQEELTDAKDCLQKCPDPPTKAPAGEEGGAGGGGAGGRSHSPPADGDQDDPEENEEDEDVGEVEEEEEEEQEGSEEKKEAEESGATEEVEETHKGGSDKGDTGPKVEVDPKVCNTVHNILTGEGNLSEACTLKYVTGKNYGWRCVAPSGEKSGSSGTNQGSICVPPRRRRLYVGKLEQWVDKVETQARGTDTPSQPNSVPSTSESDGKTATQPQGNGASKDPKVELLKAFVESAAVETFFLWDRYKKIKEKERQEEQKRQAENGGLGLSHGQEAPPEDKPEDKLKKGIIPEEFKRQMFYTLGDYRDIVVRGVADDTNGGNNIILNASGNKEKMKEIQKKIDEILNKQSGTEVGGVNQKTVQHTQTPLQQRKKWWEQHAESIWNGMICALSYNTDTKDIIESEYKNLIGKDDNKNIYKYDTVTIDSIPISNGDKNATITITLSDFASRPTFFRWLEEWGEEFCRKKKHKLDIIKKECTQDDKPCSSYGEDCDDQLDDNPSTDADLKCPGCGRECRKYKKWIERKKDEFTKQEKAFPKQKTDAHNNNGFCGTQGKCDTAGDFLNRLKNGPCKKDNEGSTVDFNKEGNAFQHAKDCAPCSQFTVDCKNCNGGGTNVRCENNKISADDIKNGGDSTEINMLVSDKSKQEFKNGLEACQDKCIFEGIRKDVWTCGNVCGYNVCKPENVNGEKGSGENNDQIITIRALVTHWVQNFLDDYNRIKHRISHCKENSEQTICKKDCKDKCNCVKKWVEKKTEEWPKIRDRYLKLYKSDDGYNKKSLVRSFMETLIPLMDLTNGKEKIQELNKFLRSYECNCADNSQKKGDTPKDIVECLLEKLGEKAKECKDPSSGEPCPPSTTPSLEDDDIETEDVKAPEICGEMKEETKVKEESGCEPPATTEPKETTPTEPKETPSSSAEEPAGPSLDTESEKREEPPPQLQSDEPSKPIGNKYSGTYVYIYICVLCICICGYDWIYICGCICVCVYVCVGMIGYIFVYVYVFYIYILYIYIYIEKEKNEKKKKKKFIKIKKKKEKDFKNNKN